MASQVDIANRALQMVGASRISTLEEGSKEADEVLACYDILKFAELQENLWTFATTRKIISADTDTPEFGRSYQYQLPANFLREAPYDPKVSDLPDDYLFEGRKILTNDPGPLSLRYIRNDVQESQFDPMFVEALAARIAYAICEPLTQSTSKKEQLADDYVVFVRKARTANSIQAGPIEPEVDEWVYARLIGT